MYYTCYRCGAEITFRRRRRQRRDERAIIYDRRDDKYEYEYETYPLVVDGHCRPGAVRRVPVVRAPRVEPFLEGVAGRTLVGVVRNVAERRLRIMRRGQALPDVRSVYR